MLNQIIIVGRLKEIFNDYVTMTISNPLRNKQDKDSVIDVHFIGTNIMDNIKQYVQAEDIIGIKGFIKVDNGLIEIVADKVTFLSRSVEGGEIHE